MDLWFIWPYSHGNYPRNSGCLSSPHCVVCRGFTTSWIKRSPMQKQCNKFYLLRFYTKESPWNGLILLRGATERTARTADSYRSSCACCAMRSLARQKARSERVFSSRRGVRKWNRLRELDPRQHRLQFKLRLTLHCHAAFCCSLALTPTRAPFSFAFLQLPTRAALLIPRTWR